MNEAFVPAIYFRRRLVALQLDAERCLDVLDRTGDRHGALPRTSTRDLEAVGLGERRHSPEVVRRRPIARSELLA